MYLTADSLSTHLARGPARLYTLHGDEPLLLQEAADSVRAAARAAGYTTGLIYTVEPGPGFNWRELSSVSQSMSLFGERRLIELRIPNAKPGKEGSETLIALAANHHGYPDLILLITLPRLDASTQKSAWFKALADVGVVVRADIVKREQLPSWITQRLKAQGQQLPAGVEGQCALQFIAERVEGNLLAAHQEIQKLRWLYPPGELTLAQIHAAVLNVARYDVFHLGEAMLTADMRRITSIIDGLRNEGEAPALVLWMLAEEIRILLRIKRGVNAGQPMKVLLRENRRQSYEKLIEPAIAKLTEARLETGLLFAAQLDRQLKGLPIDASLAPIPVPVYPWDGLCELAMKTAAFTR